MQLPHLLCRTGNIGTSAVQDDTELVQADAGVQEVFQKERSRTYLVIRDINFLNHDRRAFSCRFQKVLRLWKLSRIFLTERESSPRNPPSRKSKYPVVTPRVKRLSHDWLVQTDLTEKNLHSNPLLWRISELVQ